MSPRPSGAIEFLRTQAAAFAGRAVIVGKGPSFAEFDAQGARRDRFIVGLNEAALRAPCHAAFVIDEDILLRHAAEFAGRGLMGLIVPWVLHQRKSLGGLALYGPDDRPPAAEPAWAVAYSGAVFRFNLATAEPLAALGEPVTPYNFSAPTLAHLLAMCGFRDIRLAGVDGGTQYSKDFGAYEYKKLRSLQDSFDVQFDDLRRVRDRFGVDFTSVRCEAATVLIGAEPEQCLATEVLKWSIESRTFLTVRYADPGQVARELYSRGQAGTPFSFQRLYLPRLAGHRGRGVYFDSDMLVMRDVYELFNWDMGEHVLLGCEATPGRDLQYSVFLVDNARATWDPDLLLQDYCESRLTYEQLMRQFAFAEPRASTLPMQWNSLELFEHGRTANLHYTDMGTQPWLSVYNPNADLWCEALSQAAQERAEVRDALERSSARGWIRPSLPWQVEHRHYNPWTLPPAIKRRDREWLPPHEVLRQLRQPRPLQLLRWRLSSRIRRAMQSRAYGRVMRARLALRKMILQAER